MSYLGWNLVINWNAREGESREGAVLSDVSAAISPTELYVLTVGLPLPEHKD